jgi:hypothetical protein
VYFKKVVLGSFGSFLRFALLHLLPTTGIDCNTPHFIPLLRLVSPEEDIHEESANIHAPSHNAHYRDRICSHSGRANKEAHSTYINESAHAEGFDAADGHGQDEK